MRAGPSIFLSVLVSLSVLGIFTNCVEAQSPCDEACNENIGFPACAVEPSSDLYLTNQTDPIIKNSIACICTDKLYLHEMLTCAIKECAINVTSLNEGLVSFFNICQVIGGVTLPSIADFFKEIDVATPDGIALISVTDGTATATTIPSQTATTVPYSLRETTTVNPGVSPTDTPGNAVMNGVPLGAAAVCAIAALML
ncbi:hypothetical protein Q9L58_004011 [Maublancomyces gigas]|uniref:Extracellular membrane protein CFEM domain-containing protein n=1 Tax=Discina gigas TaxID=1032678 RepID=A0ABR3GM76_9PEZI